MHVSTTLLGVDMRAINANFSVYLPMAEDALIGEVYWVVNETSSPGHKITVYPSTEEATADNVTISGAASFSFDYRLSSVAFYSNGSNWFYFNTRQSETAIGAAPSITNHSDSEAVGEIIYIGTAGWPGTTTKGKLYFFWTDSKWYSTDSDDPLWSGATFLGVAMGTNPATDGMLIRGLVRVDSAYVDGTPLIGRQVYVSEDNGDFDFTPPSGSGDAVRCVGHCLGLDGSDILLLFDPSRDYHTI